MKSKTVFTAVLCMLLAAVMLAGCGATYDPKVQVQGNLDAQYLNQYSDEYLKMSVNSKSELDKMYEKGLEIEADYFINYFEISIDQCPDTTRDRIIKLYRDIYARSKYEVGEAEKSGDNYLVSVTVYPIDIFEKIIAEDMEQLMENWRKDDSLFTMTDEELEAEWADRIIQMCTSKIASIGYLEPETISVQIVKNEDENYTINESDVKRIDELIIKY